METAFLSSTAPPMIGTATSTGAPAVQRRSEGNMALGLFSKIAAARKENLSAFSMATVGEIGTPGRGLDKRTVAAGASHFPDLDTPTRTPTFSERKVTAKNIYHNSKWTKHNSPEDPSNSSPSTNSSTGPNRAVSASSQRLTPPGPSAPGSRLQHLLPPHQKLYQQRRSVAASSSGSTEVLRDVSGRAIPPRPATASEILDTRSSGYQENVRGYVRRATDISTSLDPTSSQGHIWHPHRNGDLSNAMEMKLSESLAHNGDIHIKTPAEVPSDTKQRVVTDHGLSAPNQEVHFAVTAEVPGVPIVYRNQKTKATNPERLNLDRRNLPVIPLLEGEQVLRLLNLQNNAIRRIENLIGLPNLIFLDLYNNRIEKLENLHLVPNLRVLMMGKNRVRTIENLECLKKLDVLDLHSNEIEQMQNLNELKELRVLNLGGNMISTLENIDKLTLLTELNLRRNQISHVGTIGKLPSLLRLFLSNNKLESFESLEALFQVSAITELRLDSNGVCGNQVSYRSRMIRSFPSLKHLDLKPLSEADRKEALQHVSSEKSNSVDEAIIAARTNAISCVKTAWERRPDRTHLSSSSKDIRDAAILTMWGASDKEEMASHVGYEERDITPTSREELTVFNNNAGFSEIEVYGDYRVLVIHGNALEILETTKAHAVINAISFRYIELSKIMAAATSPPNANLKLFTRLRRLIFAHNDLQWLSNLNTKAEEVFISQNPVCGKTLLKRYVAGRLTNTLRLNGEEITSTDRHIGRQLFPKPSAPRSRPPEPSELSTLLPSKARVKESKELKPSRSAVSLSSTVESSAVSEMFSTASDIEKKNEALDQAWKGILLSVVKETLQDIERRNSFMSGCLDNL